MRYVWLLVCWLLFLLQFSTYSATDAFVITRASSLYQRSIAGYDNLRSVSSSSSLYAEVEASPFSRRYLATCIPGLAPVLAEELEEIHHDISNIVCSGNAAVTFHATREASLHALCWTRTAHRILELVADSSDEMLLYDKHDVHDFFQAALTPDKVKSLLGDGQGGLLTMSVKVILNNPRCIPKDLNHSHYTALTIKNAICDLVRELHPDGIRPSVDIDDPDVPFVAVLLGHDGRGMDTGASMALYRSLSPPSSLHKRGYRNHGPIHKAAMKESLAAGLLRLADFPQQLQEQKSMAVNSDSHQGKLVIVDPMAGSGSLIIEAALMATDLAPALMRIKCGLPGHSLPPVVRWKEPQHQQAGDSTETTCLKLWKQILMDATARAKAGINDVRTNEWVDFHANDIHDGAVDCLEDSLVQAGLTDLVHVYNQDCYDLELEGNVDSKESPYLVVTNPPWGVRLTDDVVESWEGLRHFLRDICPKGRTEAWVLSGHKKATAQLKLRRDKMIPLQTGEQHLRWIQYTIGSPAAAAVHSSSPSAKSTFNDEKAKKPVSAQQDDAW